MNEFIKVAKVEEVPPNSMKTFIINDEAILIANVEGKYYAIGAYCKHAEWDLSEGQLIGKKIICAGHGAIWDLETGKAEFEEPLEDEPVYEVKIENGMIYVKLKK